MNIDGWLKDLKVPRAAYRVVSLLPLVYVAWADGKVQKSEREVILRIARENGLLDHGGEEALARWLSEPPTRQQLQTDLAALNELARSGRGSIDGVSGADEEQLLLAWCQDVADAAGGMLGLGRARNDAETAALKTIAAALDVRSASQWRTALKP
jgi:hypothetical protein